MNYSDDEDEVDWFKLALSHDHRDETLQARLCIEYYYLLYPRNDRSKILRAMFYSQMALYELSEQSLRSIRLTKKTSKRFLKLYHWQWATLHLMRNERQQAIEHYDLCIKSAPNNAENYIDKAKVLRMLSQDDEAIKTYQLAIAQAEQSEEAWLKLGKMYCALSRLAEAKESLEQAIALVPEYADALKALADVTHALQLQAMFQANEIQEVIQTSDADVSSPATVDAFGLAYDHEEREECVQALVCLDQFALQRPRSIGAPLLRARVLRQLGNIDEGFAALKIYTEKPNTPENIIVQYHFEMARLHKARNEYAEAIVHYDILIKLQPNSTISRILKGGILAKMGRYEEALASHYAATTCEGDVDEAWYNIGLIRRAQMRLQEAQAAFEQALAITPDYPEAERALQDIIDGRQLQARLKAMELANERHQ